MKHTQNIKNHGLQHIAYVAPAASIGVAAGQGSTVPDGLTVGDQAPTNTNTWPACKLQAFLDTGMRRVVRLCVQREGSRGVAHDGTWRGRQSTVIQEMLKKMEKMEAVADQHNKVDGSATAS